MYYSLLKKKFKDSKKSNKLIILLDFVPFIVLIIITGFRYNVGTDYQGYVTNYNLIGQGIDLQRIEFSFVLISKIGNFMHLNEQFMFLFYATITYIFMYKAVRFFDVTYMNRDIIIAAIYIFFLFNSFNTMRQMAAVSIFMYSLKFLIEKKYLKYILLILLGYFFHKSAIYFGLLVLPFYKLNIRYYWILLVIAPIFMFTNFINRAILLFIEITNNQHYANYVTDFNSRVILNSGLGVILFLIIAVLLLIFVHKVATDEKQKIIVKLYVIYISFYFIFLPSEIATRMLYYPMVAIPFALSLLPRIFILKYDRLIIKAIVYVVLLLLLFNSFYSQSEMFMQGGTLDYDIKILWFK